MRKRYPRSIDKPWRLLIIQAVFVVMMSITLLLAKDRLAGFSALLGGLVCIIPSVGFILRFFRRTGAQAAKQILVDFYAGEALKIFITIILFALVFAFVKVNAAVFFLAFLATQLFYWLAPWVIRSK